MNGRPDDEDDAESADDVDARRGRSGHRSSSEERSSSFDSRSRRRKAKKKRKRAKEKRSGSRHKHKRHRRRRSSQGSSQSDDSSSSDRRHRRKRKKKNKRSRRNDKDGDYSADVVGEVQSKAADEMRYGKVGHSEGSAGGDSRASVAAIAEAPKPGAKPKGPMTQAEYQELRSQLREVYDPQTGRTRLVRGTGEIVERIVSSSEHANLNRTATYGDGSSYARDIMRAAGARKMGEECTGKICNTHSSRHLCCTQDAFQTYASGTVLRS
mmetsp:Transcript_37254/g.89173  ORF Transcript_37254/g.89173 Transcript_37254/m.89173 type:complete len:268 (-) Transcript_37254:280-1083(-)